ncbi:MAG TPA: glycosyltransferase [Thermoanaerobaculia bacterium]|nr:glycosyltransferase [Thermoanaerobaculia bacterium]
MTAPLRIALVGPVYPYRAGIAYCTTRLAEELGKGNEVLVSSFRRQYPKRFYPGGDDVDPSLRDRTPAAARFALDVIDPVSWWMEARAIRRWKPDVVVFVWWIWVWALPYLVMRNLLDPGTRVVLQCHNVGEKEPAWWKEALSSRILGSADALVVHAATEEGEARLRLGRRAPPIHRLFLPVHELGTGRVDRAAAKGRLGFSPDAKVVLFFGHVRPFKGLDLALRAWSRLRTEVTLAVAGELWWGEEESYRRMADEEGVAGRVRFEPRFIPDDEIAVWFGAADLVLAPYRTEAQSGVVLTAFHFGRPVIATTVGGMPEIVEEGRNGMLIPPESPEAIADAVDAFFETADREGMERGALASAGKYSWEEYGSALGTILRKSESPKR